MIPDKYITVDVGNDCHFTLMFAHTQVTGVYTCTMTSEMLDDINDYQEAERRTAVKLQELDL